MKEDKPKIEILNNILNNIGIGLAVIAGIAYIIIVFVLIEGFEAKAETDVLTVFVVLGAVAGVLISLSLRSQGIQHAKQTEIAKRLNDELRDLKGKSEKTFILPMWLWFTFNFIKDVIFKGVSSALTIYFTVSIMYEGIKDYTYLWLAAVNLVMFVGFGLMGLSGGYDRYMNYQIPYLQQKIEKLKKEKQNELSREIESLRGERVRDVGRDERHRTSEEDDRIREIGERSGSGSIRVFEETRESEI